MKTRYVFDHLAVFIFQLCNVVIEGQMYYVNKETMGDIIMEGTGGQYGGISIEDVKSQPGSQYGGISIDDAPLFGEGDAEEEVEVVG